MPAPLLQFGLMPGQLVEPLVDLHAAAELRDEIAGLIQCGSQIRLAARRQCRFDLLGERSTLSPARDAACFASSSRPRACCNGLAGDRSDASRFAEMSGKATAFRAQPQLLALGGQFRSQAGDLLFQLADLALQLDDPRLLFLERLDPCGLMPQCLVDGQARRIRSASASVCCVSRSRYS